MPRKLLTMRENVVGCLPGSSPSGRMPVRTEYRILRGSLSTDRGINAG